MRWYDRHIVTNLSHVAPEALSGFHLGGLFCIEFAAGTLGALAFVPPAPVGALFYRGMSAVAAIPLLVGLWLLSAAGAATTAVSVLLIAAVVALAGLAIPTKGSIRWVALGLSIAASGAAVIVNLMNSLEGAGSMLMAVAVVSALGSGLLVGAVGVAMWLGHAYLTFPNLRISHLARLNRLSVALLLLKAMIVIITVYGFAPAFEPLRTAIGTMGGILGLFTRFAAGIALPLLFAWMVASSLKYNNTRSATGILYASTVLVLIGEAVAMSMRGVAAGVPL